MKKVFSLLLALSMLITGSFGVMAQAQTIEPTNFDEINFQITSKEKVFALRNFISGFTHAFFCSILIFS